MKLYIYIYAYTKCSSGHPSLSGPHFAQQRRSELCRLGRWSETSTTYQHTPCGNNAHTAATLSLHRSPRTRSSKPRSPNRTGYDARTDRTQSTRWKPRWSHPGPMLGSVAEEAMPVTLSVRWRSYRGSAAGTTWRRYGGARRRG